MKVNNVSIYMGDDERILRKSEAEKYMLIDMGQEANMIVVEV